jgi:hypothetical protein
MDDHSDDDNEIDNVLSRNKLAIESQNGVKRLAINSKHLVDVIKSVNKHPPLQPVTDRILESEPFPILFYHMNDVRREVTKLNDEEASGDLEELERITEHMAPRWKEARQETFESGLVSYDMIWKLFHPGDLVVREDISGNLWLLVLVQITYGTKEERSQFLTAGRRTEFTTWFLDWDGAEKRLSRKSIVFHLSTFSGQRAITSLPVYPIHYREGRQGDNVMNVLAERGRKWWKAIIDRTSCLEYNGLAVSLKPDIYRQSEDRSVNYTRLSVC